MAGTPEGARKRAEKLLAKDPDYFSKLGKRGKKGGKLSSGSFNSVTAAKAGAIGKRKPVLKNKVHIYKAEVAQIKEIRPTE